MDQGQAIFHAALSSKLLQTWLQVIHAEVQRQAKTLLPIKTSRLLCHGS